MKTLKSIQYLRAIAAILVVYCHAIDCQMQFGTSAQQKFYYLENFGAIGVDIFFIISGFIISYITAVASKQLTIKEFLKRRFIRIVPIYYLVTAILFTIFLFNSTYHIEYSSVLKSLTILPLFDSGFSFWHPILFIGWTLSFEWFFYILYCLFLRVISNTRDFIVVLLLCCLVSFGLLSNFKDVHFVFITNPILIEFALGVCLSIFYRHARDINIIFPVLSFILGLFFYCYYIFNGYGVFSEAEYVLAGVTSLQRAIFWGMPSFLIVFGLLFIERAMKEKFFTSNIFLLLGDASYSIYLIHPIILLLFSGFWKRLPILSTYISMDILVIILLMFAIVSGIIFHKKVEAPFLKKIVSKK